MMQKCLALHNRNKLHFKIYSNIRVFKFAFLKYCFNYIFDLNIKNAALLRMKDNKKK